MKSVFAFASIVLLLGLPTAHAQTIDFGTFRCGAYVELPKETQDLVAVWLDGFLSDDEDAEDLQVDFSGTDADFIHENCLKHPDNLLQQSVEESGAE